MVTETPFSTKLTHSFSETHKKKRERKRKKTSITFSCWEKYVLSKGDASNFLTRNTSTNHGLSLNFTILPKAPAPSTRWPNPGGKSGTTGRAARLKTSSQESWKMLMNHCVFWTSEVMHFFPWIVISLFYYELHHPLYLGLFCLGVRDICSFDHPPPIETNILSINTRHRILWSR